MDLKGSRAFFLILLLMLLVSSANSQNEKRQFDREKWKELKKDMNYRETPPESFNLNTPNIEITPGTSSIFQAIIILALGTLLIFLIYKLLGSKFGWNKKVQLSNVYKVDELEEDLPEAELDIHLRNAIQNADYRLAIRIYYLKLIQGLSDKKIINWKKEKTNYDYLNETFQQNFFPEFKKLTTLFEIIWYGNKRIEKEGFENVKPHFDQFLKQLDEGK